MPEKPRPDGPVLPSFSLVREELDAEQASHDQRSAAWDTKAGLLLAASGVLVGFDQHSWFWIDVFIRVFVALAAGFAVWVFVA